MSDTSFRDQVYDLVGQIPSGRVMTYGQIAALCGNPRAARVVGGIAHYGPQNLPWHRVVNKQGGMARGYWGGKRAHQTALETEGVEIKDFKLNVDDLLWWPK